jgi:hypothetical protein
MTAVCTHQNVSRFNGFPVLICKSWTHRLSLSTYTHEIWGISISKIDSSSLTLSTSIVFQAQWQQCARHCSIQYLGLKQGPSFLKMITLLIPILVFIQPTPLLRRLMHLWSSAMGKWSPPDFLWPDVIQSKLPCHFISEDYSFFQCNLRQGQEVCSC